jgi:hypothetical protein
VADFESRMSRSAGRPDRTVRDDDVHERGGITENHFKLGSFLNVTAESNAVRLRGATR